MSLLSFLELNANFGKTSYYGFWFSLWFHCVLNVTICFYFLWSCLVLCSHQRINFKTHAASVFPYPCAAKRDQRNAKTIYEQKLAVSSKVQLPCSHPVPWYYHCISTSSNVKLEPTSTYHHLHHYYLWISRNNIHPLLVRLLFYKFSPKNTLLFQKAGRKLETSAMKQRRHNAKCYMTTMME